MSTHLKPLLTLTVLTMLLVTQASHAAERSLVINTAALPPASNDEFTGFDDAIAREVFRRMGVRIKLVRAPGERSLINVNTGIDDGTLSRIGGLAKRYPNIVQFTEPVRTNRYSAFAMRSDIEVNGWQSLAPYGVGHITGWKIVELNLPATRSVTRTANAEQLMRLLASKRIDVAILNEWGGVATARRMGLTSVRALEPALANRKMFFYLNRRHADLIDEASATLRTLKADGTWERIYAQKVTAFFEAQ